ncbi:TPA: Ltp family lipoprotein [Streptococcus suis]|nr:Ltp family lipoprotein [Streptococcus suis]
MKCKTTLYVIMILSVLSLSACSTKSEKVEVSDANLTSSTSSRKTEVSTGTSTTEASSTATSSSKTEDEQTVSREFRNALSKAEQYLDYSAFSKEGLYDQLIFEKFPEDAARYAVETVSTS